MDIQGGCYPGHKTNPLKVPEVLQEILNYLSLEDLISARLVDKMWCSVASNLYMKKKRLEPLTLASSNFGLLPLVKIIEMCENERRLLPLPRNLVVNFSKATVPESLKMLGSMCCRFTSAVKSLELHLKYPKLNYFQRLEVFDVTRELYKNLSTLKLFGLNYGHCDLDFTGIPFLESLISITFDIYCVIKVPRMFEVRCLLHFLVCAKSAKYLHFRANLKLKGGYRRAEEDQEAFANLQQAIERIADMKNMKYFTFEIRSTRLGDCDDCDNPFREPASADFDFGPISTSSIHLERLSLDGVRFGNNLVEFIRQQRSTLKKLEITMYNRRVLLGPAFPTLEMPIMPELEHISLPYVLTARCFMNIFGYPAVKNLKSLAFNDSAQIIWNFEEMDMDGEYNGPIVLQNSLGLIRKLELSSLFGIDHPYGNGQRSGFYTKFFHMLDSIVDLTIKVSHSGKLICRHILGSSICEKLTRFELTVDMSVTFAEYTFDQILTGYGKTSLRSLTEALSGLDEHNTVHQFEQLFSDQKFGREYNATSNLSNLISLQNLVINCVISEITLVFIVLYLSNLTSLSVTVKALRGTLFNVLRQSKSDGFNWAIVKKD